MSMSRWRDTVLLAIVFLAGVLVTSELFVDVPQVKSASGYVQNIAVLVAAFALGVGIINIGILHGQNVTKRIKGRWQYSSLLLILMVITIVTGLVGTIGDAPSYLWIFNNVRTPLDTTTYALLAFFVFSAGARVFNAKNREALIFLIAGVLVMLKNAPIGEIIWPGFVPVGNWILDVPNTGATRGIIIGAAIGSIAIAIRILLGYERSYGSKR